MRLSTASRQAQTEIWRTNGACAMSLTLNLMRKHIISLPGEKGIISVQMSTWAYLFWRVKWNFCASKKSRNGATKLPPQNIILSVLSSDEQKM
jgi:hypothetical protein